MGERLYYEKDGILKEIAVSKLPTDVVSVLEKEYEQAPIVGISKTTYRQLLYKLEPEIRQFAKRASGNESEEILLRIFIECFHLDYIKNPDLVQYLWCITLCEDPSFSCKDINTKTVSELSGSTYMKIYKDFREWDKNVFKGYGISAIKFAKFFYSLLQSSGSLALA